MTHKKSWLAANFLPLLMLAGMVCAQEDVALLQQQIDAQAKQIDELRESLEAQSALLGLQPSNSSASCEGDCINRVPLVADLPLEDCPCIDDSIAAKPRPLDFYCVYDDGFAIRAFDQDKSPFELNLNSWMQFRHHAFSRDIPSWTDSSGFVRPVNNRSNFDLERVRLVFSGFVYDQRLTYFIQLDGDTDGGHIVDVFDHFWTWDSSEAFQLQVGKRKVPGSRQWLISGRDTRMTERPMANNFFRPDRTVGIWGVGQLTEVIRYELMVGNGYGTANLNEFDMDDSFTYAATSYFDPWGDFGRFFADFEHSPTPLLRLGHSFVFSPQKSRNLGDPLEEANIVRLTDGTPLTQVGAISPAVTVSDFDIYLYGVDIALKYQGWSLNSEVYARWIDDLKGDGLLSQTSIFQHGFFVEGGRFLVPKLLDTNVRYSQVSGDNRTGSEMAAGVNWYPLSKPNIKLSFDIADLDSIPLLNPAADAIAGDDGTLFRTQFQAEF